MGRICQICLHFLKDKNATVVKKYGIEKLVKVKIWKDIEGEGVYDMKTAIEKEIMNIKVKNGDYICSRHLIPLPADQSRYSKRFLPLLLSSLDLRSSIRSIRKIPPERLVLPPPESSKAAKRKRINQLSISVEGKTKKIKLMKEDDKKFRKEVEKELKKNEAFKSEIDSLKEEMTSVKKENEEMKVNIVRSNTTAPIDKMIKPGTSHTWYGLPNFDEFYNSVLSFLKPYHTRSTNCEYYQNTWRMLQRTLIQLRNGFRLTIALALLEPTKSKTFFKKMFSHTINCLYEWALTQISLPHASEWVGMNTERLDTQYPGHLFFFVDGTVIPIYSPKDFQLQKKAYNSKHGFCAYSFFIMVAPNGRVVYVSLVNWGSFHDATAWNTAYKFPPIDSETGRERIDQKTLISHLEEYYGIGYSEIDPKLTNDRECEGIFIFLFFSF